jgi:hypothetical protein
MYEVDVAANPTELRQKLNDLASPWYLHSVVPFVRAGHTDSFLIIAKLGKQDPVQAGYGPPRPEDFKRW